jgi:hypothetical protein
VWLLVLVMSVCFQCLQLPAFAYQDKRPTPQYEASETKLPGELLVKFHRGVGRQKRQEALARVVSRVNHLQDRNIGIDDDGNGLVDDVYGYNFYNDDADFRDDNFHGTHCAGTIGAAGDIGKLSA